MDRERLREIREAPAFTCHKTIAYGEKPEEGQPVAYKRGGPQQCAGLMAVLAREAAANQIMQVAQRLGHLDVSTLDPRGEAYASWRDVLAAHRGREPA